jgi:hypothetical protein
MKKSWMLIGSAVLSISLTGCGANDNAEGNGNNGKQQAQVNQDARPRALQTDQGGDRTLRVNNRAEQHVEQLKEVQDAQVIISNNNAYVAVRLANNNDAGNNNGQNTGTGTNRTGTMGTGNQGNNQGNKEGNGIGQSFMENGMVNQNGDNGTIDGKGDAGNGNDQSRALGNGNNNNNAGDNNNKVGTGNGNTNGTGNTNGQNRGTATQTNNYSPVSNAFEQKIADQVRKADKKIHKVYVSVNPDLYNTMNTYVEDIRADRDRDSLFRDFNNTINNFFGIENE